MPPLQMLVGIVQIMTVGKQNPQKLHYFDGGAPFQHAELPSF
jgi:hypothetical protein